MCLIMVTLCLFTEDILGKERDVKDVEINDEGVKEGTHLGISMCPVHPSRPITTS